MEFIGLLRLVTRKIQLIFLAWYFVKKKTVKKKDLAFFPALDFIVLIKRRKSNRHFHYQFWRH